MAQSLKTGVAWSFLSTLAGALVQLFFLYLVATREGPATVALFSVLAAFQGVAYLLQDGGLMTYYIHRQDLDGNSQSALFWLAALIGLVISALVVLVGPSVAAFYDSADLILPFILIAGQVLVLGIASQAQAHLMKSMRLVRLAKIEIFGKTVAVLAVLLMMFSGAGGHGTLAQIFIALFVGSLLRAGLVLLAAPEVARTALRDKPDWRVAIPAARYTGYHLGAQVSNQFRANLDVLLLAKLLGTEVTGIYALAKELVLKPSRVVQPVIARVVTPLLASRQGKLGEGGQAAVYLKSLKLCSWANTVVFAGLAVTAPFLVVVFLDENYRAAMPLIPILCVWGYCRALGAPSASLAYANGRTDVDFWWNMLVLPVNMAVVWLGAQFSLTEMAFLFSAFQLVLTLLVFIAFTRRLAPGASFVDYSRQWISGLLIVVVFSVLGFAQLN